MPNKNLEIKTATIEIKVVRVDGHKMTKATFRQIQGGGGQIDEASILGWVNDDGDTSVLFNDNGAIRRRYVKKYWSNGSYVGGYNGISLDGKEIKQGECKKESDYVRQTFDQLFIAT
jgi:hypothetical protein